MPRRPRVVLPGVAHHVTQRGNNRQAVFRHNADCSLYLALVKESAAKNGVRILAWCLMPNHVHLVVVPDSPDSLARGLGHAHYQYARAFNMRTTRVGHLWQNRFFSCVMDGSHLLHAVRYVELNPVRAGLTPAACEWPWSSALAHVRPGRADPLLALDWQDWFRGWDHAGWKEWLDAGESEDDTAGLRRATLTGEPLGSAEFLLDLEHQTGRRLKVRPRGRPPKQ
jgi:putative transposase